MHWYGVQDALKNDIPQIASFRVSFGLVLLLLLLHLFAICPFLFSCSCAVISPKMQIDNKDCLLLWFENWEMNNYEWRKMSCIYGSFTTQTYVETRVYLFVENYVPILNWTKHVYRCARLTKSIWTFLSIYFVFVHDKSLLHEMIEK